MNIFAWLFGIWDAVCDRRAMRKINAQIKAGDRVWVAAYHTPRADEGDTEIAARRRADALRKLWEELTQ